MSINYKRAKITTILFGFMFFGLLLDFGLVGPSNFVSNKINYAIVSIAIGLLFVFYAIMLLVTQLKKNIIDERDLLIQKQAGLTSLMLVALYVFFVGFALFLTYRNATSIPASWFWFISYSTFAFTYFITSFLIVYLYIRDNAQITQ